MKHLLDVNVILAAVWANHPQHAKVDAWLAGKQLATCPLSELGFLRVSTHSKAINARMADARRLLRDFISANHVEFVPADMPALHATAARSENVTDSYLAELASEKKMRLATLDAGIKHAAVEFIE
jgi:toxin-antitoxin system PIN domain toxin